MAYTLSFWCLASYTADLYGHLGHLVSDVELTVLGVILSGNDRDMLGGRLIFSFLLGRTRRFF